MTYNTKIRIQQGGSEMTIAGGSLNITGGAFNLSTGVTQATSATQTFSGGFTLGQASGVVVSGGLQTFQAGACLTVNYGASNDSAWSFITPNGTIAFSSGRNAPAFAASPGAVYYRTDGSMSNVYINSSDGVSGSVWRTTASA